MRSDLSRRAFLSLLAAAPAACSRRDRVIPGRIVGGSAAGGHLLRDGFKFPPPARTEERQAVIVGSGVAGLTAARRLSQAGQRDLLLLELEETTGGTATSGRNDVSAYPWAAHYVPVANRESTELLALFAELGVITGHEADGTPRYAETMLCADPPERLWHLGRWQEGLVPRRGLEPEEQQEYARFFTHMEELRAARGFDGLPAFAIPLERSSRDVRFLALDAMNFGQWLDEHGYTAAPLRWYIDYACRDDYGARAAEVSAWAGLHYFASRRGWAANASRETVLTWPEGNGWLVHRLREGIAGDTRTGALVHRLTQDANRVQVDYFDLARRESVRIHAPAVICATPRFVTQRLLPELPPAPPMTYSPWMVANLTLDRLPATTRGEALAWDNVIRGSASLGYVVATHQSLQSVPQGTVLTHYWPLDHLPPADARREALAKPHAAWCQQILADLAGPHPELHRHVRGIDVWLWGHGMIRPTPAFLWGGAREPLARPHGRIHFAHTDLSGMALFEEAHARGLQAAEAVLALT